VKPLEKPPKLVLVPLGTVPRSLLVGIASSLHEVFGPPVVLAPAQDCPGYAFNKDRAQYHTTAILRRLSQTPRAPAGAPVLGVTDVDLFVPDAPFVFGEADRASQTAVVSFARLATGPDGKPVPPERVLRRIQVEAVHELGHLLGLSHCQDIHCAMLLSHKPTDSDRKGPGLCGTCRSALGLS
jgi:archaemetzincin